MWHSSTAEYSRVHKWLHWLVALVVVGMFGLGLWMVSLDYYHPWYRTGPDLHRSVGVVLVLVMALRLLWVLVVGRPEPLAGHRRWEVILARWVHVLLYVLVFAMGISGYLISTADGREITVFDQFSIASMGEFIDDQEDVAGEIHEILAFTLIGMAALHALAALKHHVIDKDRTLKRMI